MKKLKILQISKYYFPFSGGIETVVKCLSEALADNGHDVTVGCSYPEKIGKSYKVGKVQVKSFGTKIRLFSQPISPGFFWYLWKNRKHFDVIHHHTPNPLIEAFLFFFIPAKKIVVTYHCDVMKFGLLKHPYYLFLKFFLQRVKSILVPTKYHISTSDILPGVGTSKTIIPFFLNIGSNSEEESKNKAIIEYKSQELVQKYGEFLLFVGRLVPYKGVRYLIESMQWIDRKLVIVGIGVLEENLVELVKELKLEDKVFILGHVKEDIDLQSYYKAARLFILPSFYYKS